MNIVYICNEINLKNGWGVVSYHTIRNSLKFFDEVTVITNKKANNVTSFSDCHNLRVFPILHSINNSALKMGLIAIDRISIKRHCNIIDTDIVHILVEPLLPLVNIFKNSKKIFSIHGTYSDILFKAGFNQFLFRGSLKKIDRILSNSEYTKNRFNNIYKQEISVIPLGIDNESFRVTEIDTLRERAFVFVGHLKIRKGLIYALEAFKNIMRDDEKVLFYIIGAVSIGQYADTCLNYIKKNKMNKQVVFLGKVDDNNLIEIYNKSICNLLPSVNDENHYEGFGLVHLEANACGTPTIGSIDCGNESAIINGKTGFLCKQKDVDSIQKSMESILNDFDNDNFEVWTKECTRHAKENDWKYYFNQLNKILYRY